MHRHALYILLSLLSIGHATLTQQTFITKDRGFSLGSASSSGKVIAGRDLSDKNISLSTDYGRTYSQLPPFHSNDFYDTMGSDQVAVSGDGKWLALLKWSKVILYDVSTLQEVTFQFIFYERLKDEQVSTTKFNQSYDKFFPANIPISLNEDGSVMVLSHRGRDHPNSYYEFYKRNAQSSFDLVFSWNADLYQVAFSPSLQKFFGYDQLDFAAKNSTVFWGVVDLDGGKVNVLGSTAVHDSLANNALTFTDSGHAVFMLTKTATFAIFNT